MKKLWNWGQKRHLESKDKKSARHARTFSVQMGAQQPQFTPRRYDRLADEGYTKNVIAYRCISLIAQNAGSIPWRLKIDGQEVEDHPALRLLTRPNPGQSRSEFIENLCGHLLIAGNCYIEAVGTGTGALHEMWVLRPDRMQVVPGPHGLPSAYRYNIDGGHKDFSADTTDGYGRILHLKSFHPLNDWYGMSPLEAAAFSIDQHNEAAKWNTALLQSSGRPSGALIYKPTGQDSYDTLTDEQRQNLRQELETYYQGAHNAGRPLVLEGGLDWREMALSPKDLDWAHGKDMAAREIALAFHVPPQLVGIEGSLTYANFEQARLAFYDDAVLPLMDHIRGELNIWLSRHFGEDLKLEYDRNAIEALAPRREKIWKRVKDADFMTMNEKRAALGLGRLDTPNADRLLVADIQTAK
tara:strand:+ start:3142 stop:4377 length:1236 start_codon:yes stop_codon:yes gene_type:complete